MKRLQAGAETGRLPAVGLLRRAEALRWREARSRIKGGRGGDVSVGSPEAVDHVRLRAADRVGLGAADSIRLRAADSIRLRAADSIRLRAVESIRLGAGQGAEAGRSERRRVMAKGGFKSRLVKGGKVGLKGSGGWRGRRGLGGEAGLRPRGDETLAQDVFGGSVWVAARRVE
jgi:hypothetical protein